MASAAAVCELAIPEERVIRALSVAAIPGFWGDVLLQFRIKPEAIEHLLVIFNYTRNVRSKNMQVLAPSVGDTEREAAVRTRVSELSELMLLRVSMASIKVHFEDGHITRCELQPPEAIAR